MRPHTKGKLHILFGCGGDRDKTKRPLMGDMAVKLADFVYVTDDNPRTENAEHLAFSIRSCKGKRCTWFIIHDETRASCQNRTIIILSRLS